MGKEGNNIPRQEIINSERQNAVELWRTSKAEIIKYQGGIHPTGYQYGPGERLVIKNEQVMDTCEEPWVVETVDFLFEQIKMNGKPIRVLEFGFGLGLTANRAVDKLVGIGEGEYRVVELNEDVYKQAILWKERTEIYLSGRRPTTNVKIVVQKGEAGEEAEKLSRGRKFDAIISDTFPLISEEKGINDLLHLSSYSKLLSKDGVFAFFPYFPGFQEESDQGDITSIQHRLLYPYFDEITTRKTTVFPPEDYEYLHTKENKPVRILPVVVAKGLKMTSVWP